MALQLPLSLSACTSSGCRLPLAGRRLRSTRCVAPLARRTADWPLTLWHNDYIQSLPIDFKEEEHGNKVNRLKEDVRQLFCMEKDLINQLELVDVLRHLGVAYHFNTDIKDVLATLYCQKDDMLVVLKDNLYATSLLFRLLREYGFHISEDVFDGFMDETSNFKSYLCNDIEGILSLYEASFLAMEGENKLDEARAFTTKHLGELKRSLVEPCLMEKVIYALELPVHWRMPRLHSRWFIDWYERKETMNPILLSFAKWDFNMVQSIYKKELKELSSWWSDLGLVNKLGFARDRLVENYLWTVGWAFEPKFQRCRKATTKGNCLISTIDDIYDIYGSLDELELFTDTVERWDANAIEQLPEYMKICFLALFNTTNEVSYETLRLKGVDINPYLRKAWKDLCKAYLVEAKWYHSGYMPSLKEYLDIAWISISGHVALTHAYCTSEDITKESLDCFKDYPDVVRHSSMLIRLYNDLTTSTAELERGDVPKSIQCYMHERGVTEVAARKHISDMINSSWKDLNREHIVKSSYEESFKIVAIDLPRMAQCIYQAEDGYGDPGSKTKDHVISLLIKPIPVA